MVLQREPELLEVVGAARAAGRLPGRLDRRQKQRDQQPDDRDDHQELHEREAGGTPKNRTCACVVGAAHWGTCSGKPGDSYDARRRIEVTTHAMLPIATSTIAEGSGSGITSNVTRLSAETFCVPANCH